MASPQRNVERTPASTPAPKSSPAPTSYVAALARENLAISDLKFQAEHALIVLDEVKNTMLSPLGVKRAPKFSAPAVQRMLGMTRQTFLRRLESQTFPPGEVTVNVEDDDTTKAKRTARSFSVAELQQMLRIEGKAVAKPAGGDAFVLASCHLKGGTGKTTLAVTVAEGLALRGANVLLVDLDPQASATTLLGLIPDSQVRPEDTFLACVPGALATTLDSVDSLIQKTYWPGVDLLPAAVPLSEADYYLPLMTAQDAAAQPYAVLENALASARKHYDVIVIDTPPSLSYLTTGTIYTADGVLVPMPPNYVDFSASVSFWRVFSDLAQHISAHSGREKIFEFVSVVLNKVRDKKHPLVQQVSEWVRQSYGAKVMDTIIPHTIVTEQAAVMAMGTIYDLEKYEGSRDTYERAREAFDSLVDETANLIERAWQRRHPKEANE